MNQTAALRSDPRVKAGAGIFIAAAVLFALFLFLQPPPPGLVPAGPPPGPVLLPGTMPELPGPGPGIPDMVRGNGSAAPSAGAPSGASFAGSGSENPAPAPTLPPSGGMMEISLRPVSQTLPVPALSVLTATVGYRGDRVAGRDVEFDVTAGPDAGVSGSGVTDMQGEATFSFRGTKPGTDTITGYCLNESGIRIASNPAEVSWQQPGSLPEFPSPVVPALLLVGVTGIVLRLNRKTGS